MCPNSKYEKNCRTKKDHLPQRRNFNCPNEVEIKNKCGINVRSKDGKSGVQWNVKLIFADSVFVKEEIGCTDSSNYNSFS